MPAHTINIHSDGHATPNSQHVFQNDTVNFTSNQGSWTVTFDGASPFCSGATSFSGASGDSNGGAICGTIGQTYKYTSCCTQPGGLQACDDPDIVIDASPKPHPKHHEKHEYKS